MFMSDEDSLAVVAARPLEENTARYHRDKA
jgi:hypothetical protein